LYCRDKEQHGNGAIPVRKEEKTNWMKKIIRIEKKRE